ncbi:MAG: hypothetical protein ACOQNV_00850 [Mycoplasmoidaceae bacterium]
MSKPYKEITKSEFNKNYNVVKVLTTKSDIMNEIKDIKTRLTNVETKLDNVIKLNNLKIK